MGEAMHFPLNVHLHPSSFLWGSDDFQYPLLACFTIQRTTKLYAFDATEAIPYALLLFGGDLCFDEALGQLKVGDLSLFRCRAWDEISPLVCIARRALQHILQKKLDKPWVDFAGSRELSA